MTIFGKLARLFIEKNYIPISGQKAVNGMPMTLEEIKKVALPACSRFRVKRLDLFGSIARGSFTPDSDIDLLVEFDDPDTQPAKRFFGLLHYLEDRLETEIDLLTIGSLKNPFFRKKVLAERVTIYEG
ncbi:MAG: nucleotidyltransferase family protein [Thermoguttaceae bacterium]